MKILAILLILQSTLAYADKKITQKDFTVLGKIDDENFKNAEPSLPVNDLSSEKSRFSMSCKDISGKEFKKGDDGFETCMKGIKSHNDSGKNNKDKKDANSANFNFKIGD